MPARHRRPLQRLGAALLALTAACASGRTTGAAQSLPELDGERLLADVRLLSADSLE